MQPKCSGMYVGDGAHIRNDSRPLLGRSIMKDYVVPLQTHAPYRAVLDMAFFCRSIPFTSKRSNTGRSVDQTPVGELREAVFSLYQYT